MYRAHIDDHNPFIDYFLHKGKTNVLVSVEINVVEQFGPHPQTLQMGENFVDKIESFLHIRTKKGDLSIGTVGYSKPKTIMIVFLNVRTVPCDSARLNH